MAAESQKVPLEIFFNPTILSDDNLFSEFSNFVTVSRWAVVKAAEPAGIKHTGKEIIQMAVENFA